MISIDREIIMKRTLVLIMAASVAACSSPETTSNIPDEPAEAVAAKGMDATEIANALKSAGLPVSDIVTLTEDTDDNNMMGRPGMYVSKVYFVDERYRGKGMKPEEQNTIETFATEEDATKRKKYIEGVIEGMPMFNQYIIQSGKSVLRLDRALKPSEAKTYEAAL
tara:strand:- start:152 stop:649 length:498 start_codon:yes stop_codon:yes gene_type:complete